MKVKMPLSWKFVIAVLALSQAAESQTAPPSVSSGGVVSASAFGKFTSIGPGSWVEIYGSNLAADSRSWTGSDFHGVDAPTSLDGTKVTIGGQATYIDYISPGQVNAQIPSSVGTGPQPLVVTTAAGSSAPYSITVNLDEPGLLAPSQFVVGGTQYMGALFSDGVTYAMPPGAVSGVPSRRAQIGDVITLYGVGFGPVTPTIPAGQIVQESNSLALPLTVMFGSVTAALQYQGLAPNAIGLYQFNVVVPSIPSNDLTPVTFSLGGSAGTQRLFIAVQGASAPLSVQAVSASPNAITGGADSEGLVTLSAAASAGGVVVTLNSSSAAATVQANVTVPPGANSAAFIISTSAVFAAQSATITASYNGTSAQATLSITPAAASTLPQFKVLGFVGTYIPSDGSASVPSLITITPNADGTYTAQPAADPFGTFSCTLSGSTFSCGTFNVSKTYAATGISATGMLTLQVTPGAIANVGAAKGAITLNVSTSFYNLAGTLTGQYSLVQ
ncbi:MAG TPA: IPT/TIG domain-containing protein [Bryobacteraceae bacterium]|nr:IPT/TIG domain-containing protein [Bryobacteraceae bacterium]